MKARFLFFLILSLSFMGRALAENSSSVPFDQNHSAYTTLLTQYVDNDGLVNYRFLKNNQKPLQEYLQELHRVQQDDFRRWTPKDQIAYLINLYNAETLELIVDNYPVSSIKEIGGWFGSPWKKKEVSLFGERVTLDHVEHDILRKNYKEPGIHFALVCAAISCPPLRQEAYRGKNLDHQLADQARRFLSTSSKNRLDKENQILYLSKIFSWFEEDFTSVSPSVIEYLRPYFQEDERAFLTNNSVTISYTSYNWNLNTQQG